MPLVLALLCLLCLLPGAAWAQEPVELRVWHAYRGEERLAFEAALGRFDNERPDLIVAPLALPYDSFFNKLEAAATRGNGPDLFVAAHERVGAWARSGLVQPVGALPDGLHPRTVDAVSFEGQRWGVPLAYKCLALFSNRALVPEPPRSTTALFALKPPPGGFPLAYQSTEPYFHAPWMHAFGGGVFQGGVVALDRPGNAQALDFARSLLLRGLIPDEPTGALVTQLFNEGLAATVINGPWFIGEIDPAVDFVVSPLPFVDEAGAAAAPFLTVEAAFVSAYAAHPDAAADLAAFLAGTEVAIQRSIDGRQSVATLAAYDDPRVGADPVIAAFRAQLDATVPMPNEPAMAATWEPMARNLRRVVRGSIDGAAGARLAAQEHAVVSRPPPEAANPWPLILLAGVVGLGGLAWVVKEGLRRKKELVAHRFAYLTVLPVALAMGLLVIVPFVVGAAVSLFTHH